MGLTAPCKSACLIGIHEAVVVYSTLARWAQAPCEWPSCDWLPTPTPFLAKKTVLAWPGTVVLKPGTWTCCFDCQRAAGGDNELLWQHDKMQKHVPPPLCCKKPRKHTWILKNHDHHFSIPEAGGNRCCKSVLSKRFSCSCLPLANQNKRTRTRQTHLAKSHCKHDHSSSYEEDFEVPSPSWSESEWSDVKSAGSLTLFRFVATLLAFSMARL